MTFSALLPALALAESWSGKLLDRTCVEKQQQTVACDATVATTAFSLMASGKIFKFDPAGDLKASAALKNRDRVADQAQPPAKEVMAKVQGSEHEGTIAVESVEVQQ
jgi:hypothetical protein